MRPVLFYIGDLPIFSYSIFMILGMITLFGTATILAHRAGRSWEAIWPVAVGVFVGGILGARLTQLMAEPARTAEFADFYSFLHPGTLGNIVGMMIGGFVGGLAIRLALELPSSGNFYAPALAAASVLWRTGCTLAGCCHGVETNLPWAMVIDGAPRHPTMIYEGLFNLLMLPVIIWAWPRWRRDDELLLFYLGSYAIFRFLLEFIRLFPPIWAGLTGIQLLCLVILTLVTAYFVLNRVLTGRRSPVSVLEEAK